MDPNVKLQIETTATTTKPLWQAQVVRLLQLLGILATFIGGTDFLNLLNTVSPKLAAWLIASGPALAVAAKPLIEFFGDWLDDGVINKSFRLDTTKVPVMFFLMAMTIFIGAAGLTSCAGAVGALTGAPVPTTPVKRVEGGVPFELATSDVLKAEQDAVLAEQNKVPKKAWGTYDAGLVAQRGREIINSGK